MGKKKKGRKGLAVPADRLQFPEDEGRHPWLTQLLKAYALTDLGVGEGIRLMTARGHRLACGKGCGACCVTHRHIPVYPIELVGITWYATEKLGSPLRERLKEKLWHHHQGDPCVFLLDDACAIHPLRPMACRQFNVFNAVCAEGEDAYYTRRQDVLTPIERYTEEAFYHTMPFYDVTGKAERRRVVKKGLMHAMAKDMQGLNWEKLASKMVEFDLS